MSCACTWLEGEVTSMCGAHYKAALKMMELHAKTEAGHPPVPKIGMQVHYVLGGTCFPGVISEVRGAMYSVFVMREVGYTTCCHQGKGNGTWHWPEECSG